MTKQLNYDDTYNGWTNRETWAAALHFSNDPALTGTAEHLAAEAIEEAHAWLDEHPDLAAVVAESASAAAWPAPRAAVWVPTAVQRRAITIAADKLEALVDEWATDLFYGEAHDHPGPTVAMMIDEIGSRWRVDWRAIAEGYVATALEEAAR